MRHEASERRERLAIFCSIAIHSLCADYDYRALPRLVCIADYTEGIKKVERVKNAEKGEIKCQQKQIRYNPKK